jgi:hypothetical protein
MQADERNLMRYRLRTLLIVVTLAGLLLGGRIEYIRCQAAFHTSEALKFREMPGKYTDYLHHDQFAQHYRQAIVRPWSMVKAAPRLPRGDK